MVVLLRLALYSRKITSQTLRDVPVSKDSVVIIKECNNNYQENVKTINFTKPGNLNSSKNAYVKKRIGTLDQNRG
jgi:hypothetical protein